MEDTGELITKFWDWFCYTSIAHIMGTKNPRCCWTTISDFTSADRKYEHYELTLQNKVTANSSVW